MIGPVRAPFAHSFTAAHATQVLATRDEETSLSVLGGLRDTGATAGAGDRGEVSQRQARNGMRKSHAV